MSANAEAHDPSGPSGHLPFADSAKGRKSFRHQLRGSWCFITLPVALCGRPSMKRTSFGTL